jgi:hypothetical protein
MLFAVCLMPPATEYIRIASAPTGRAPPVPPAAHEVPLARCEAWSTRHGLASNEHYCRPLQSSPGSLKMNLTLQLNLLGSHLFPSDILFPIHILSTPIDIRLDLAMPFSCTAGAFNSRPQVNFRFPGRGQLFIMLTSPGLPRIAQRLPSSLSLLPSFPSTDSARCFDSAHFIL